MGQNNFQMGQNASPPLQPPKKLQFKGELGETLALIKTIAINAQSIFETKLFPNVIIYKA